MNIEDYSKLAIQYYTERIPDLLEKYLRLGSYKTIIDCGCGDGSLLYALRSQGYLDNKRIIAVDLSQNRVNIVKAIDKRIITFVDNAEELLSIRDESIDFFISTQVIEHVNDKKMIDTMYRVVKKKGTIYISTIFKKWYGWYYFRNNGKWVLDPTHLREYTKDYQLISFFKPKRFKILENQKRLEWYPIMDFFIKRLSIKNRAFYNNKIISMIRGIKIPVFGYYKWEIVLNKI